MLWSTSLGMIFFGVAAGFTFDYYSFMAARFLLAMVSLVRFFFFFSSLILLQYFHVKR